MKGYEHHQRITTDYSLGWLINHVSSLSQQWLRPDRFTRSITWTTMQINGWIKRNRWHLSWDNVVNGTQSKLLFLPFTYLCTLSSLQNFSFDKQDRSNPTYSTLFGDWRVMFHIFEGFRPNIVLFFTSSTTTSYSSSSSSSLILLLSLLVVVVLLVSSSPQFYCWPPSSPQWIVLITSTFPAPPEFYCLPPPHVSPTPHSPSPPLSSQLCFLLPLPPPSQFCSLPPRSPSPSSRNTCMNENGG